jgi:hypothetical protein
VSRAFGDEEYKAGILYRLPKPGILAPETTKILRSFMGYKINHHGDII